MRHHALYLAAAVGVACASPRDAKPVDTSSAPPETPVAEPAAVVPTVAEPAPAAPVSKAAPARMVKLTLENGSVQTIEPLKWVDYEIVIPGGGCSVSGRITALAGAKKDFDAFFLNDDNYKIWQSGMDPAGTSSGRAQRWSFSERVTGPGHWHLVVSNRFSDFAKKVVKVWATRTCPAGASS